MGNMDIGGHSKISLVKIDNIEAIGVLLVNTHVVSFLITAGYEN
jgi:hypothetical protein